MRPNETGENETLPGTAAGHEAAQWFALLIDEQVSDEQRSAFRKWLCESEENARAYAEIERLWSGAGMLPDASGAKARRRTVLKGGVAALVLLGGAASYRHMVEKPDYETATGEIADIVLPDGSRMRLSTATAVKLEFDQGARRLRLLSGEAYFEVARDPSRPFTIVAADASVTALGTAFSVRLGEAGVNVAVSEHAVSVSTGQEERRVGEGQVAVARQGRVLADPHADVATELSWLDGRLVFISRPLGDVVAELERWYKGRIFITDAALAQRSVTLIVDVQRAGNIPETLRKGLSLRVETYSPWLTLIRPL